MATIPASAIADAHASISTSDVNNGDGRAQIVVNELLSFIAYKLQLMAPDTIVQLCASFFSEADIDSAKLLLFDLCADQDDRQDHMIKRASGPKKKQLSLKDIVSLFTRKHDAITARVNVLLSCRKATYPLQHHHPVFILDDEETAMPAYICTEEIEEATIVSRYFWWMIDGAQVCTKRLVDRKVHLVLVALVPPSNN